jgi:hypothetical protein
MLLLRRSPQALFESEERLWRVSPKELFETFEEGTLLVIFLISVWKSIKMWHVDRIHFFQVKQVQYISQKRYVKSDIFRGLLLRRIRSFEEGAPKVLSPEELFEQVRASSRSLSRRKWHHFSMCGYLWVSKELVSKTIKCCISS